MVRDHDACDDDHLHQQDGGLAPHLRHQDDPQLAPFAQVVLLTAMEYLRQEEQETEETREEHGAETKKAWKPLHPREKVQQSGLYPNVQSGLHANADLYR